MLFKTSQGSFARKQKAIVRAGMRNGKRRKPLDMLDYSLELNFFAMMLGVVPIPFLVPTSLFSSFMISQGSMEDPICNQYECRPKNSAFLYSGHIIPLLDYVL